MHISRDGNDGGFTPLLGAVLLVAVAFLLVSSVTTVVNSASPAPTNITDVTVYETPTDVQDHRNISLSVVSEREVDRIVVHAESDTTYFRRAFDSRTSTGVQFRSSPDCPVGDCIEWAESSGADDGRLEYGLNAPENTGNVSISVNMSAVNYTQSGLVVYALTANGTRIPLACDGEVDNTLSAPTDFENNSTTCLDRGPDYRVNFTKSVSTNSPVTAVYIETDVQTTDGAWDSLVRFSGLSISNPRTNETRRVCITCHVPEETNTTLSESDDYASRSLTTTENLTLSGLTSGERVTVVAVRDGRETVVKTHIIGG